MHSHWFIFKNIYNRPHVSPSLPALPFWLDILTAVNTMYENTSNIILSIDSIYPSRKNYLFIVQGKKRTTDWFFTVIFMFLFWDHSSEQTVLLKIYVLLPITFGRSFILSEKFLLCYPLSTQFYYCLNTGAA